MLLIFAVITRAKTLSHLLMILLCDLSFIPIYLDETLREPAGRFYDRSNGKSENRRQKRKA